MGSICRARSLCAMIAAAALSCMFAGCAAPESAMQPFNYENVSKLELGKMKSTECEDVFGKPWKISTKTIDNNTIETVMYAYGGGTAGGVLTGSRLLVLIFRNGELFSYTYVSSMLGNDQTWADLPMAKKIVKGRSTKADVEGLLGKPCGKTLTPTRIPDSNDKSTAPTVETWTWIGVDPTNTFGVVGWNHDKSVLVGFDANGLVTEVTSSEHTDLNLRP